MGTRSGVALAPSLLLISEHQDRASSLRELLAGDGFTVNSLHDAGEGLLRVKQERYEAALLDLNDSRPDVQSVLQDLQKADPQLPVIVFTSKVNEAESELDRLPGVFASLNRSQPKETILTTVRQAISRKALQDEADRVEQAFYKGETFFRAVIESALDGIIVADVSGRISSCNKATETLFSYSQGELLDQPLTILMPERYREAHRKGLERVKSTGQTRLVGRTIELHGLRKDGSEFPIELSLATWATEQGMFYGGIIRDLTMRKRAEQERDGFFFLSLDMLCIAGTDGYFKRVNPAFEKTLGWTSEQLLAKPFSEFVHPEDRTPTAQALQQLVEGQSVIDFENRYLCRDESYRWIQWRATPVAGTKLIYAVARDITERKHTEVKEEASRRLANALSRVESQFIADAHPRVVFENLLHELNVLTQSEYGFIGEILYTAEGVPYLKTQAITNIAWNDETRALFQRLAPNLEFFNLKTLFGEVMTTGKPVITNNPSTDPRRGGLPKGHPAMHAFLGLPFYQGEKLVGMVGIANRPGGYDEEIVEYLKPFLSICANLIEAYRHAHRRAEAEAALRESEEQYRGLVDSARDVIFTLTPEGTIASLNPVFEQITGWSVDEWLRKPFLAIVHPEDAGVALKTFESILSGLSPGTFGLRIRSKSGGYLVGEFTVTARVRQRTIVSIFGIARDITDRRRAEEALKDSEQRFRQMAENIREVFWMTSPEKDAMLYVSPAYEEIWGRTCESLYEKPRNWLEAIHPEDRARVKAAAEADQIRGDYNVEYRIIRPDGSIRWIWDRAFPVQDQSRQVYRIVGIAEDITGRKRAEAVVDRLVRRNEQILHSAGEGIYGLDREGRATFVNPAAARMLGYTVADLIRQPMHQVLHHSHADGSPYSADACPIYAAYRDGSVHEVDNEVFWRKDGTSFPVEYVSTPLREGGQTVGAVVVFKDITERKQTEEAIRERTRLLALEADIGQILNRNQEFRQLLQECTEAVVRHLTVAFARLWTLNPYEQMLELQASAGMYTNLDGRHSRIKVGQFKIGQIAAERTPHLTNAVIGDPRVHDQEWAKREGMVAFAGYPLLRGEEVLGVMALFSRRPLPELTLKMLAVVADRITMAIERQVATEALQKSREGYRALYDDNPSMYFTVGEDTTILNVNEFGARQLGYHVGELVGRPISDMFYEEDKPRAEKHFAACLEEPLQVKNWELRKVHRDGHVIWVRETARVAQNVEGRLEVFIVCEDITEKKRAEDRLARINQCLVSFGPDADENITRLVGLCGELLEASCALYSRLDSETLCSVGQWNTPGDFLSIDRAEGHICTDLIRQAGEGPLVIRNLQQSSYAQSDPNVTRHGLQTYFGKAVTCHGISIGSLCAVYQWDVDPSEVDKRFIGIIASAIGVEEERRRAEATLKERTWQLGRLLDEREQMARDLHDGIIQSIYAVGLGLYECQQLAHQNSEACARRVSDAITDLNLVIRDIRKYLSGLQPKTLSADEFSSALESLSERMGSARAPHFILDIQGDAVDRLTPDEGLHLLKIAQEGMSNCLRHSHARRAVVSLQSSNGGLRFQIEDDGTGFEVGAANAHGLGLRNMETRALIIRAQLQVESTCGQGTKVTLFLPKDNEGSRGK
ncbi:MAG: PAS domain S-box protein [Nitrospiraceae bacterium]